MILYHVSLDLEHDGKFKPTIPLYRMVCEEEETPRICFSETIEGCLTGIPGSKQRKEKIISEQDNRILVYQVETNLIPPRLVKGFMDLYENNLVPDANLTHETWVLENLNLKGTQYQVHDIQTETELVIPCEIADVMSTHNVGPLHAYQIVYDDESLTNEDLPSIELVKNVRLNEVADELLAA